MSRAADGPAPPRFRDLTITQLHLRKGENLRQSLALFTSCVVSCSRVWEVTVLDFDERFLLWRNRRVKDIAKAGNNGLCTRCLSNTVGVCEVVDSTGTPAVDVISAAGELVRPGNVRQGPDVLA